jgi:hypothetical protein
MPVTPIKVQLGPIADGLIIGENFAPGAGLGFKETADFLIRYPARAAAAKIDPLGVATMVNWPTNIGLT